MRQTGSEREYSGAVDGLDGVELVLLSAGEIPRELAAGRIHLGVTGSDLVRDKLADWEMQVAELAPLGFGHADLIIAVPACWIDVDTLDDLDAAAAAFRAAHGHRLRIATKYHRLVRDFLRGAGRGGLSAGGQPGRDRGHGEEPDGRGDRRHHLDPARPCGPTTSRSCRTGWCTGPRRRCSRRGRQTGATARGRHFRRWPARIGVALPDGL